MFRIREITSAPVNLGKNDTREVIAAPGAGKQLWIWGLFGTTDADGTIYLIDSTPAAKSGVMPISVNGGFVLPISNNQDAPWLKCATNTAFQATLSANSDFDGIVLYSTEDA